MLLFHDTPKKKTFFVCASYLSPCACLNVQNLFLSSCIPLHSHLFPTAPVRVDHFLPHLSVLMLVLALYPKCGEHFVSQNLGENKNKGSPIASLILSWCS